MKNFDGYIPEIQSFSTVDGPGIRTTIFLGGCSLRCKYCHNPEYLTFQKNNVNSKDLADKILQNKEYFKNGGGVTFSGGEPLFQSDFIIKVAKILKKEKIHIALDTSGIASFNQELLKEIDLVILDIKGNTKEDYKEITGFDKFSQMMEFLELVNSLNIKIWVRQVIVPGFNDNKESILKLKEITNKYKCIEKIELLPYHSMGKEKYQKLNLNYELESIPDLDLQVIDELSRYL